MSSHGATESINPLIPAGPASGHTSVEDLRNFNTGGLIARCARDTGDTVLWSEFLHRFGLKIKSFIRSTLHHSRRNGSAVPLERWIRLAITQENDLFQNVMLRLVDHDCAVLKRFKDAGEEEFLKYLAIITRSVVRDSLRIQRASKRSEQGRLLSEVPASTAFQVPNDVREGTLSADRRVLERELRDLSIRTLRNSRGPLYKRDRMIFELYFLEGLSVQEIARLKNIGLSKTAVENVLSRLKDRVRALAVRGCQRARE